METQTSPYHIRWMIRRDMADVLNIENLSFKEPATEEDITSILQARNIVAYVITSKDDDTPLGFCVYALHKNSLEIIEIVIHPDHRNKGVGSAFINKLTEKLTPGRRTRITAKVKEEDGEEISFFISNKFRMMNYSNGTEPLYMQYQILPNGSTF